MSRRQLIAPEDYECGVRYEITFSPADDYFNGMPKQLHKHAFTQWAIQQFRTQLNDDLKPYAWYFIQAEISEVGRLHFHGWIRFNKYKHIFIFVSQFLKTYIKNMEIAINPAHTWKDDIKAEQLCKELQFPGITERILYWNRYIHKQDHLWKSVGVNPVIRSIDNPNKDLNDYNIMAYL